MPDYDSRPATWEHIHTVRGFLGQVIDELRERAHEHDQSKLVEPERGTFDEFTPKLKASTYGSDEYKTFLARMGDGLAHHYKVNDHHPEHFIGGDPVAMYSAGDPPSRWAQGSHITTGPQGIHAMNLVQVTEMLCDWKAATMRHADGDLERSIRQNAERFGYGDEIRELLLNTAHAFGWI